MRADPPLQLDFGPEKLDLRMMDLIDLYQAGLCFLLPMTRLRHEIETRLQAVRPEFRLVKVLCAHLPPDDELVSCLVRSLHDHESEYGYRLWMQIQTYLFKSGKVSSEAHVRSKGTRRR